MSKIYYYKMTADEGGAPCVSRGVLTLAICKPKIRMTADVGDYVIGFAAKRLNAESPAIYIARVGEKMWNGDYYRDERYAGRRDCIYRWLNGRLVLRPDARHHHEGFQLEHDVGIAPEHERANVLVSRQFVYWGGNATAEYKVKYPAIAAAVEALTQGHRVNHEEELMEELEAFVKEHLPREGASVLGKPTSERECGGGECERGMQRAKKRC